VAIIPRCAGIRHPAGRAVVAALWQGGHCSPPIATVQWKRMIARTIVARSDVHRAGRRLSRWGSPRHSGASSLRL